MAKSKTDRSVIIQTVHGFSGLSSTHDPNGDLATLLDVPGKKPVSIDVLKKNRSAIFVCGVLRKLGCKHAKLKHELIEEQTYDYLWDVASESSALHVHVVNGSVPQTGDLCRWAIPIPTGGRPCRFDYVAFLLDEPDANHRVLRAGADSEDGLVTETTVRSNYVGDHWRPLIDYVDVIALLGEV
jgi:hypothetical protein